MPAILVCLERVELESDESDINGGLSAENEMYFSARFGPRILRWNITTVIQIEAIQIPHSCSNVDQASP